MQPVDIKGEIVATVTCYSSISNKEDGVIDDLDIKEGVGGYENVEDMSKGNIGEVPPSGFRVK